MVTFRNNKHGVPRERLPTERRLAASRHLDRMTTTEIVRLMNREDRKVAGAVSRAIPEIVIAVDAIVRSIRQGGRLIYIGAGSSGRMGVLDTAESAPTFGVSDKQMIAVIAGGSRAVTHSVEGAEDSPASGARDLRARRLKRHDVVVGIAASGTTPYVLGALRFARDQGAVTVAITSNRQAPLASLAKIPIVADVGPEILTGSTRLKAGTAQKMVLNMLSTATMARLGHVYENLMIDLTPQNEKLSARAVRILSAASGASVSTARRALRQSGHDMRAALRMLESRKVRRSPGNMQRLHG